MTIDPNDLQLERSESASVPHRRRPTMMYRFVKWCASIANSSSAEKLEQSMTGVKVSALVGGWVLLIFCGLGMLRIFMFGQMLPFAIPGNTMLLAYAFPLSGMLAGVWIVAAFGQPFSRAVATYKRDRFGVTS